MTAGLRRRRWTNRLFLAACTATVAIVLLPLGAVLFTLVREGVSALGPAFFLNLPRPVGEPGGGVGHALVGTLILVAGALVMAAPVGILAGVFLASDRAPRAAAVVRLSADVLSGVPSIVVGIFAYAVLVVPLRQFSGLAGSLALAVLMLPTLTRTTEEVVRMVPWTLTEAAVALGAPRWRTMLRVVLPAAGRGVAAGVIVAVARGAGETAPLMFTAFGSQFWTLDPTGPMAALPLVIFNYAISPYDDWHAQAWAAALVLTALVLAGNLVSRAVIRRSAQ
ncbi:MAG TPA: phosphate ABC transporter permease PstA [Myxococcota bacterium]|nr:phosphate ABC transporter permease PstA [Myxococcota bacterium]